MTPQPLSSSQLQTVLLEAKSKNRLLLTRSEQEICPSESTVPSHQRQFIKREDQGQGFLSEALQRRRPPANRIQLLLEPVSKKRYREKDQSESPQPSNPQSRYEDQVLVRPNNKRRCTETQDDQPGPSLSDTKLETLPQPVDHTDATNIPSSPTEKKDVLDISSQAKPPPCHSPETCCMELDQKSVKAENSNEVPSSEQTPIVDSHCVPIFNPSVKIEPRGVEPRSPRNEGDMPQEELEDQQRHQGTIGNETDPHQVSIDEEMKPVYDEQRGEAIEDEGVHRIPTFQDSPDWPVFEPDESFQHHGVIVPSSPPASAEVSNIHLLLEVPGSPMRLFEASSPSRPLWEDDLPSVEPVADDHSQAIQALFGSDTMNPTHLNQKPVDKALISKPPGREHPLYRGTRGQDGLYHCPWEKDSGCNHKPAKLKCTFDKFIDSHLKPYKCRVPGCQSTSFSSTACLFRHEREAHALHGYGDKPFLCPQEGCERATPGNGFPRRWNLVDHMRRRHKLDAPVSGIIDARTSIKMVDKKETKETDPLPAETEEELKSRWETYRLAFEAVMERLDDPENPDNAALTEEAQVHLSAMLKIQGNLDEISRSDDEKDKKKSEMKGKDKTNEKGKGDDTEGKDTEEDEK
ncbi:hypothetical protein CEP54_010652 [Fusarium duplospermum]|uniref:C2H2-type domain-containing protein n=1 Tax=Fusarium duplospermum TaxID=1325734 RepID=A0A428PIV4_9HYPO|nr:hypothetical protein CEP54_010652 [Fusarium duplospermum]